ncbi:hypothetical protein R5R35_012903 [Gryllus longicercus]|uniref:DUF7153 domain-containing protein n=1 Tax=Gryllus longicercus TaxID=2509291 RepID=A0AAN9VQ85_9ORTH
MNILFRKHFHGESDRSGGGGGGGFLGKAGGKPGRSPGRRSREYGGGYSPGEDHHYRTHIFLSPTGVGCQACSDEGLCLGPPRRPSVTLMKWATGGGSRARKSSVTRGGDAAETPTPTASRQVSFSGHHPPALPPAAAGAGAGGVAGAGGGAGAGAGAGAASPREPVSLATLNRDCFIIPVASLDRFLPAGVPMPLTEKSPSFLSVLEVDDPKLCVLLHLMSPLEPIEPVMESPLAKPLQQQKSAASDLLSEIGSAHTAIEGMLLSNMEKNAQFPFISYYVINKSNTDPMDFFKNLRAASLKKFDPRSTRYTAAHTLDLFNEVASIARPPLEPRSKRPRSAATGYIICVYKVFEGDDNEKFEKNWLYWTGARMLYRYLPKSVGLRRITLHKSLSSGDKMYLLMCECSNFMDNLSAAAILLPALRARLCGYTGLYRTTASF